MRDRVVVEIESDIDRFIGADALDQIGLKAMCRERKQASLLFGENFADRPRVISGPGPLVCDAIPPFERLSIEVLECSKAASGKEGIANITDHPLDPSLLIAATGPAR